MAEDVPQMVSQHLVSPSLAVAERAVAWQYSHFDLSLLFFTALHFENCNLETYVSTLASLLAKSVGV